MPATTLPFPPNFRFGTSTSAFQVEGAMGVSGLRSTQWDVWTGYKTRSWVEHASASLDYGNGSPSPVWSAISRQAQTPSNYDPKVAADHYHRYIEDMKLARDEIGTNAYRFSIEWARVEPREGVFDQAEIEHYRQMIRTAKRFGQEPFVGLWHWTEPLWFTAKGSWAADSAVGDFDLYARRIALDLGMEATYWVPINEPEVYVGNGWIKTDWPPGKSGNPLFGTAPRVLEHLADAHKTAYRRLHMANPRAQVGSAINNVCFEAEGGLFGPRNTFYKALANRLFNGNFRRKIAEESDWLGLNFYMRHRMGNWNPLAPKNSAEPINKSDLGWELYPEGLYDVLKDLRLYNKPIYITENGLADRYDQVRGRYIQEALHHVARAIQDGVDVRGYFYWSLLDNFEWDKGYWPEFGLIHVDRATLERTVRPSAKLYRQIIEEGRA